MMSFHRPERFDFFIYQFQEWGRLWSLILSTLESSSDSDRNCCLTIGNTNVEIIMQRIRSKGFQTCLDAVRKYMQSLGLDTVTVIWPQTDSGLDGSDSAAAY